MDDKLNECSKIPKLSKICFIKTCCEGFVSISACIGYLTAQWRIKIKKKNDCNQNIFYQECIKGTTNAYSLCVLLFKNKTRNMNWSCYV